MYEPFEVFGGIDMGGAITFACKSQGCQWAGLVYFLFQIIKYSVKKV